MINKDYLFSNVVLNYLKNDGDISNLKDYAMRNFKINQKTAEELLLTERNIILDRGYNEYDYAFYPYNKFNKIMYICTQDIENLTISELLIYYELIGLYIKNQSRIISMLESKKQYGTNFVNELEGYRIKRLNYVKTRIDVLEEIVYRLDIVQLNNPNWYLDLLRICHNELLKNQHLAKKIISSKNVHIKQLKK